jgi:uncharacterized protein
VPQEGQEEPDNPAPVLELSATEDGHHASSGDDASGAESAEKASADTAADSASSGSTDTTARVLGIVGIVVGAAGVAYGVLAGRRRTNA